MARGYKGMKYTPESGVRYKQVIKTFDGKCYVVPVETNDVSQPYSFENISKGMKPLKIGNRLSAPSSMEMISESSDASIDITTCQIEKSMERIGIQNGSKRRSMEIYKRCSSSGWMDIISEDEDSYVKNGNKSDTNLRKGSPNQMEVISENETETNGEMESKPLVDIKNTMSLRSINTYNNAIDRSKEKNMRRSMSFSRIRDIYDRNNRNNIENLKVVNGKAIKRSLSESKAREPMYNVSRQASSNAPSCRPSMVVEYNRGITRSLNESKFRQAMDKIDCDEYIKMLKENNDRLLMKRKCDKENEMKLRNDCNEVTGVIDATRKCNLRKSKSSCKKIRNIGMAKGILQRRNTCDNFLPTHNISNNVSNVRRSFRILGSKQQNENNDAKNARNTVNSPDTGRRHISVARVAEAFHEFQQKLVTKTKDNDDKNTSNKNSNVSKKINMFNKVMRNNSQKDNMKSIKDNDAIDSNKRSKDENNTKSKKLKKDNDNDIIPITLPPAVPVMTQKKIIINIENGLSIAASKHDITEEELLYIKKRKAIGRSNSAMIPLRELVMTREVANSRRSLSLSLIPEDETLSLLEAVERRLNLSKETNLCDTVL